MSGTAQGTQQAQAAEPLTPQASPTPSATAEQAAPPQQGAVAAEAAATSQTQTPNATQAAAATTAQPNAAAEALDVSDRQTAEQAITDAILEQRFGDAKAMQAKLDGAGQAVPPVPEAPPPAKAAANANGDDEVTVTIGDDAPAEGEGEGEANGSAEAPREGEEEEAEDGQEPPEVKPAARIRLTHLSPDDQRAQTAIHLLTQGGMTLREATERVLGPATGDRSANSETQDPAAAAAAAQARAQREEQAIQSSTRVRAAATKVQNLEAELEAALDETAGLLQGPALTINNKLSRANTELTAAESAEREQIARNERQQTQVASDWQASEQRAHASYPAMAEKNSPLDLMIRGLADAATDPTSADHEASRKPNAPEYFAQKAAGILKISPSPKAATAEQARKNGTPAKAAPVAAKPSPTANPPAVRPASGAKGSAPPAAAKSLAQITEEELAKTEAALTGRAPGGPRRSLGSGVIFVRR